MNKTESKKILLEKELLDL